MKIASLPISVGLVFAIYGNANAMTGSNYNLLQESFTLVLSLASLILALLICKGLSGGALAMPWVLMAAGFALACLAGLMNLLDLKSILFSQYDLRLAILVTRTGAMILILAGLIFYKKRLQ
jgi:hypothetical protein